jgi:hypothetical protein
MTATIGSKIRLNAGIDGKKFPGHSTWLTEGSEGEIIGYDNKGIPIIRLVTIIVKGEKKPCNNIEGGVSSEFFDIIEEEKYAGGDSVELDREYKGVSKGSVGKITCGCNDETYKVEFENGEAKCVDVKYIKHQKGSRSKRPKKTVLPEFEGGVTFEEAAPILTLEKYALLGKENIDLESGGDVPQTNGKTIQLPKKISRVKHTRKKGEDCSTDPNLTMYVGLLYHEASHIRYGTFLVDISEAETKFSNPGLIHFLTNIVEDVRVEHQFKAEFIDQPRKIKPLVQTMRYTVKIAEMEAIEDPLAKLVALITQKACVGYTHGELVDDTRDEIIFFEGTYETTKGKKSYAELFLDIIGIIDGIKRSDATILDSFDSAQKIYALLEQAFPPEQLAQTTPPDVPIPQYDLDKGNVKITEPSQTKDPKKKKAFKKLTKKRKKYGF